MSSITAALGQLQGCLLGTANTSSSRTSLIMLEQVLATLTGCVTTYSELESIMDEIGVGTEMRVFDRAMWLSKESSVLSVLQRLQNHKGSLTLMLTILQSKSMREAENSMQKLQSSIEQLLESNADLAARLNGLEREGSILSRQIVDDASTITSIRASQSQALESCAVPDTPLLKSTFEDDLECSYVYKKAKYSHSQDSFTSSALFSTALSVFSNLSLAQISNFSMYALPIFSTDLHNASWYNFGDAKITSDIITPPDKVKENLNLATKVTPLTMISPRSILKVRSPRTRETPVPEIRIDLPEDFSHQVHVKFDSTTNQYVGLPKEWQTLLNVPPRPPRSDTQLGIPLGANSVVQSDHLPVPGMKGQRSPRYIGLERGNPLAKPRRGFSPHALTLSLRPARPLGYAVHSASYYRTLIQSPTQAQVSKPPKSVEPDVLGTSAQLLQTSRQARINESFRTVETGGSKYSLDGLLVRGRSMSAPALSREGNAQGTRTMEVGQVDRGVAFEYNASARLSSFLFRQYQGINGEANLENPKSASQPSIPGPVWRGRLPHSSTDKRTLYSS
ncbi:MAG: hypothetical protein M1820_004315 [Bogoriella megaspora]|nr:MAG: hypothetical protein M1820_004315 [Bogoriella megaspora]